MKQINNTLFIEKQTPYFSSRSSKPEPTKVPLICLDNIQETSSANMISNMNSTAQIMWGKKNSKNREPSFASK